MTLVEFYIKVLESTSFSIIEDVVYKDEDDVLTILDIPIALPTKKIINNCSNKESMNIEEKNDASTPFNSKGLKKSEHKFENTEINKIKPYNETTQNNYSSSDYSENGYLGIVIIIILIFIFIF